MDEDKARTFHIKVRTGEEDASRTHPDPGPAEPAPQPQAGGFAPAAPPADEEPVIVAIEASPLGEADAAHGASAEVDMEPPPVVVEEPTVARSKYLELVRENMKLGEETRRLQTELYTEAAKATRAEERATTAVQEKEGQLQRLKAEFQNYRRRTEREREESARYRYADLLLELLPVLDNFEHAMQAVPGSELEQDFFKGIRLIYKQLHDVLEQNGLKALEAVGTPFDPNFHEAVARMENPEVPADQVVGELRRGFLYRDRLLRPAMVSVAAGGEDREANAQEADLPPRAAQEPGEPDTGDSAPGPVSGKDEL